MAKRVSVDKWLFGSTLLLVFTGLVMDLGTGNRPWSQGHLRSVMLSPRLAGYRAHHLAPLPGG